MYIKIKILHVKYSFVGLIPGENDDCKLHNGVCWFAG